MWDLQYIKPLLAHDSAQFLNLTIRPGPPSSVVSATWDTGSGVVSCAAGLELYTSPLGRRFFVRHYGLLPT